MGVVGLLNLLKSIQKPTHLRQFAGKTLGVDAYGWLHRGIAPNAADIVLGKSSTKYVDFAMHRVRMLIHFGVIPYLVFDGDRLPSKAATEDERAERRKESKSAGLELLRLGKPTLARQHLQRAVDVTPEMAGLLIQELKRNNIQYVVAPYEADAQLAYLEQEGIVDGILSEDSDLLVFGAKTLLTKLDQYGECIMIRQADFTACREISLTGWTFEDFRRMAILSGCDYLAGIPKLGLKTAYRLVRKCKTIERTIQCAQLEGKFRVPAGYLDDFAQAEMTFLYQWVYCPSAEKLVNLTKPYSDDQLEGLTYIGSHVEPDVAKQVAEGRVNPMTKLPMQVELPTDYKPPPLVPRRSEKENIPQPDNKKIDFFFTPTAKRVPLAELDPNSFQPTRMQRHLLDQYSSRSWTPVQAPARPGATQQSTRSRPDAASIRTLVSAPQPRKRQRLCAEGDKSTDALFKAHEERSKFFTAATPKSSSLSKRRPRDMDLNIWSDDSIDEAMAILPDIDNSVLTPRTGPPTQAKSRRFSVFKDKSCLVEGRENQPSALQMVSEADASDNTTPFTPGLLAQTEALRKQSGVRPSPTTTVRETNADAEQTAEPMTPPPSHASEKPRPAEHAESGTAAVAAIAETPVKNERASVPGPRVPEQEDKPSKPLAKPNHKGSEDLFIVPDSDAETGSSECGASPSSSPTESRPTVRLDLSRFVFGPANVDATS